MFAALVDNSSFFAPKLNLCIMLAPTARVGNMTGKVVKGLAFQDKAVSMLKSVGPELFPRPLVNGSVSSGFSRMTARFGISLATDAMPKEHVNN